MSQSHSVGPVHPVSSHFTIRAERDPIKLGGREGILQPYGDHTESWNHMTLKWLP